MWGEELQILSILNLTDFKPKLSQVEWKYEAVGFVHPEMIDVDTPGPLKAQSTNPADEKHTSASYISRNSTLLTQS